MGLCIYIIQTANMRFLVMRSDDVNYDSLMGHVHMESEPQTEQTDSKTLTLESIRLMLQSMDTEWDRNVARTIIACSHSRKELRLLGIDEDKLKVDRTWDIIQECNNAKLAAEDMVRLHLRSKLDQSKINLKNYESTLIDRKNKWPASKLEELEDLRNDVDVKIKEINQLISQKSKHHKRRFFEMVRRKQDYLNEVNRLKKRSRTDQGRKPLLDSDDEEFI